VFFKRGSCLYFLHDPRSTQPGRTGGKGNIETCLYFIRPPTSAKCGKGRRRKGEVEVSEEIVKEHFSKERSEHLKLFLFRKEEKKKKKKGESKSSA